MAENFSIGSRYTINLVNNSMNSGNFMVFQQHPNLNMPDTTSLAWFAKFMHPGTNGSFNWKLEYDFAWLENKQLASGINSVTSQCIPADFNVKNTMMLTNDGGYNFMEQPSAPTEGSLYIMTDHTIPSKQVNIGIGMSGSPALLVNAEPNTNLSFSPFPEYWVAFGNYEKGQVVNVKEMTDAAKIEFPEGINAVTVILNNDNTWTVEPA